MFDQLNETVHFTKNWQQQLAEAFNNIEDLCHYLQLSSEQLPTSVNAVKSFPIKVPVSFAASIEKGNPNDPLLRQVLPIKDELTVHPGFSNDPVGDLAAAPQTGVLHKYHGRVLFINAGSCAINCRYCFRRNFPYADSQLSKQHENAGIQYLNEHTEVSEVILSGGDPLLLNDERLKNLIQKLNTVKHLKRIRIHTRLPIVLPARITEKLITSLTESTQQVVIVVHCNHANEINTRVINALALLRSSGINLFNQSVLLKGVNEHANILCDLSEKLFSNGVIPYYLHLLDKATGTGHFEVPETIAVELIKQMQLTLPGYLVPKLVKELAGALSKQTVL